MIGNKEQMNIVIVGHVDHGKSTVIGRLLADTNSLPKGKLEQVREQCAKNSKPFEYAFLLDALKDEQSQGITIDVARCFFNTEKRQYIIIDAPGHIEFLKNMVTGASRAEAALLVIDAHEGVMENSRRHGFLLKMLGIKQIIVIVNKMDLVDYSETVFENVKKEYEEFLNKIDITPLSFVPISAMSGDLIISSSKNMPWYKGLPILASIDSFEKEKDKKDQGLRFPVQDIYKFTSRGDDRRIFAGTVETGTVAVGDAVIFYPSKKRSVIKSIEGFNNGEHNEISPGKATGFTLDTEIYVKPGEIMTKINDLQPKIGNTFKGVIFWVGRNPMVSGKKYKLKIGTDRVPIYLKKINNIIDASSLNTVTNKNEIERHDVAECIFQTLKPIAFDVTGEFESTARFVIVDDYEISGGGLIIDNVSTGKSLLEEHVIKREYSWIKGNISTAHRNQRFNQQARLVVITGDDIHTLQKEAIQLENDLFANGHLVYYLGFTNVKSGLDSDVIGMLEDRDEHIRRIGELAHIFTDAGMILITTIPDLDDSEVSIIKILNNLNEVLIINIGNSKLSHELVTLQIDKQNNKKPIGDKLKSFLYDKEVIVEYYI